MRLTSCGAFVREQMYHGQAAGSAGAASGGGAQSAGIRLEALRVASSLVKQGHVNPLEFVPEYIALLCDRSDDVRCHAPCPATLPLVSLSHSPTSTSTVPVASSTSRHTLLPLLNASLLPSAAHRSAPSHYRRPWPCPASTVTLCWPGSLTEWCLPMHSNKKSSVGASSRNNQATGAQHRIMRIITPL